MVCRCDEKTSRTLTARCNTTDANDCDVERIGFRELHQHASRNLDRVKAGESIEVIASGRALVQ